MAEVEAQPEQGLDLQKLAQVLCREYDAADLYRGTLLEFEEQAFKYYEAQPFGNEVDGRSQVILPDVQETVDYMIPSILRTFVAGDHTVEFEATEEEHEQFAEEATEAINYNFMRQQDGYRILHDGLFDGLLRRTGIFKTGMETVEKVTCEKVQIEDPEQLGFLPEGVEVEEYDEETGIATLKTQRVEKRFVDYAIPTHEFRFSPNARHEDEADYLCHVSYRTRSDLIEMGFDREQVYDLPGDPGLHDRNLIEGDLIDKTYSEETSAALEHVKLCEEYARIDVDGDGIAERVKVFRVEKTILIEAETGEPSIETVEEQPFAVFSPFPRPHRLVGYSLAEKVMDIQLARSFVARQLFDGMAFGNMPRPIVDTMMADEDTWNDILSPIPGSPIRVKGGVAAVQPFQTGFRIGESLQALEWITGERESRTGITRLNQGLDADMLNKTATGTALMQAQGQQQEESIARQLAETLSRLFRKKYRLMRAEADPIKIKANGQYREINPSQWPEDMNIVVRVGLGTNSKDKRIQYRMAMSQALSASVLQGFSTGEHVFKWFDGMARDTGIGKGDDFAVNPDAPPEIDPQTGQPKQPEQKPDPEMMKVQAEQQKTQAQLQLEQEKAGATLQLQQQQNAAQIEAMREKHAMEMDQKREAAALEAQLAQDKADREFQLAVYRIEKEAEIARHGAQLKAHADTEIAKNRPGGALDA